MYNSYRTHIIPEPHIPIIPEPQRMTKNGTTELSFRFFSALFFIVQVFFFFFFLDLVQSPMRFVCLAAVLALLAVQACYADVPVAGFKPPSIPIVTSDPLIQSWVRGDNTTIDEGVVFWDGRPHGMLGTLRIDGVVYRWLGIYEHSVQPAQRFIRLVDTDIAPGGCDVFNIQVDSFDDCNSWCVKTPQCRAFVMAGSTCYLKSCVEPTRNSKDHVSGIIVPDADVLSGTDLAPGQCDIENFQIYSEGECAQACAKKQKCAGYVIDYSRRPLICYVKSCDQPRVTRYDDIAYIPRDFHVPPPTQPESLIQKSVRVYPTRTVLEYELPGVLAVTVTTLNTMFPDDLLALSMPTTTITVEVSSLDGKEHQVEAYLEAQASHTVISTSKDVVVNSWKSTNAVGSKVGGKEQKVFEHYGDHDNIDWGYLYIGVDNRNNGASYASAGNCSRMHEVFEQTGTLPAIVEGETHPARQGPVAAAAAQSLGKVGTAKKSVVFIYAYDDIYSIYYYGQKQPCYWTSFYKSITEVIDASLSNLKDNMVRSESFDSKMLADLSAKGGDDYATICALAYRQTLAASKLTWNPVEKKPELFLKEISSDGDLQTADVIFPASPLFLYANVSLLQMMLDPLMRFANNETWNPYTDPYSPHQLGVYPVANDTTSAQEQMPMENTGNIFLMMLAILQRNGGDVSFFYPRYFKVMTKWADYLLSTLPFPENQLCTDDFMGPMPNNTNLAAKGIIALNAFAKLCDAATHDPSCMNRYGQASKTFAKTWLNEAIVNDPIPHTALSFNKKDTWSTKYNLLWQRVLNMGDEPFPDFDKLAENEVKWYVSQRKTFGTPLDSRKDWVKIDWLCWGASLTKDDEVFKSFMENVVYFLNNSPSRVPFTDLYDVNTGVVALGSGLFVARPVVGGFFMKAIL